MTFEYQKYVLPRRRRYQAAGLTVRGKPRVNRYRSHPELAGLGYREYHRRWLRDFRARKKAACHIT